ncbi:MAG: hypothetical protein Q9181_001433 [Wetmoreana brouardii]
MSVSPGGTFFNHETLQTFLQDPYGDPKIPSFVPLIRNWQMEVCYNFHWNIFNYTMDADPEDAIYRSRARDPVIAGIRYSAKIMSMSANLRNLKFRVPGECYTEFNCLQMTLKFWTKVLRPVLKLRPRGKFTLVMVCYDWEGRGPIECHRHECLRIRDALQEYKDAVDRGEIIIQDDPHEDALDADVLYMDEDDSTDEDGSLHAFDTDEDDQTD